MQVRKDTASPFAEWNGTDNMGWSVTQSIGMWCRCDMYVPCICCVIASLVRTSQYRFPQDADILNASLYVKYNRARQGTIAHSTTYDAYVLCRRLMSHARLMHITVRHR